MQIPDRMKTAYLYSSSLTDEIAWSYRFTKRADIRGQNGSYRCSEAEPVEPAPSNIRACETGDMRRVLTHAR